MSLNSVAKRANYTGIYIAFSILSLFLFTSYAYAQPQDKISIALIRLARELLD